MSERPIHNQHVAATRVGFNERNMRGIEVNPSLPSRRRPVGNPTVPDPPQVVRAMVLVPIVKRNSSVQATTLPRHLHMLGHGSSPDYRIRRTLERRVRLGVAAPDQVGLFWRTIPESDCDP